ncbi:MAG: peptidylprolyl isomerase [Oscillospiraceae bacterium]|nr:peptidylprolyl isomerase [Oscillospiraceae bacterium]
MWKDRILSALLAAAIGASTYVLAVRYSPEKPEYTPSQLENGITMEATGVEPDKVIASLEPADAAAGASADAAIATLDGNAAPAEFFTFLVGKECSMLENYYGVDLASNWDTPIDETHTLRDFIKEETMAAIKQQLVLENLCARFGVELTEEDLNALAKQRADNIAQFGDEYSYRVELYKRGISEEGFERLMRGNYLYDRLYEMYTTPGTELYVSDDELRAYAASNGYITADHILLSTVDQSTFQKLDEDTVEQKRQKAEDILWQLRDSSDPIALFRQLADEYSEDPGHERYPEGYTFTYNSMVEEFDSAARALEEGEYSDIVESQYGYHIILRRPLNVAEAVEAVRDEYFSVLLGGEISRAELVIDPAAETFDVPVIYEALLNAQRSAPEENAAP